MNKFGIDFFGIAVIPNRFCGMWPLEPDYNVWRFTWKNIYLSRFNLIVHFFDVIWSIYALYLSTTTPSKSLKFLNALCNNFLALYMCFTFILNRKKYKDFIKKLLNWPKEGMIYRMLNNENCNHIQMISYVNRNEY